MTDLARRPASLSMPAAPANAAPALAAQLLAGLSRFRALRPGLGPGVALPNGQVPHGAGLFSWCALARERLARVRTAHPLLAVVLCGHKEIWQGLWHERLAAGTLFVLPGGIEIDVVNDPDPRSGLYQSLILEMTPALRADLPLPLSLPPAGPAPERSHRVALRPDLVAALVHAATAIAEGASAPMVRQARLAELLALLAAEPAARPLFALPAPERLRRMVRAEPGAAWRCETAARMLGLSEATLRRRLRAEGTGFGALVRAERMAAAQRLMAQGLGSGRAAEAVGYASRAHFARAYRAEFGHPPKAEG